MIPKKLFYCWFGKKNKSQVIKDNLRDFKRNNPEYQIIEINEEVFDYNLFKFTKSAYQKKNWAFLSDVARIWAINKWGGFYIDTDVKFIKPIPKQLENKKQIWAKEDSGYVNSGLFFGSEKENEILNEILNEYKNINYEDFANDLKKISTVKIVSKILKQHGLSNSLKTEQLPNDIIVFSPTYFAPLHYWGGGRISKKTIAIHQYSASWVNKNNKNKFYYFIRYIAHEIMYYVPFFKNFDNYRK